EALARYVEAGGSLLSEACPGRLDEHAFATRGELSPTARKLFGVRQRCLAVVREPGAGERWLPRERTWGEYAEHRALVGAGAFQGCAIEPSLYQETFECDGSQAIFLSGDLPAAVERSAGRGRAILLGTVVGHRGTAYRSSAAGAFVDRLLSRCGIQPQRAGNVLIRKRVREGQEAWLLFNPGREESCADLDATSFRSVADLFGGELRKDGDRLTVAVPALDYRVLILATA
ncbi:MAG TPA: hypothetical protein VFH83_13070, partial [Spirochaetia bacterium]|nr:hypothetical protein [Spirochaetia bacterium]